MEVGSEQGDKDVVVRLSQRDVCSVIGWWLLSSENVKRARRWPMYSRPSAMAANYSAVMGDEVNNGDEVNSERQSSEGLRRLLMHCAGGE